jgi:aminopeptidase N
MTRTCGALVAALFLTASPAFGQRLPTNVIPSHYTLWFAPDLEKQTFRGRETIQVQLGAPATSITLHAAEIAFGPVSIISGGRTQAARVSLDEKAETATLTVAQALHAGPATIAFTYRGVLNDNLRGFYISNANGRSYAVSQMEATDARRAFPSFDEPAYKATFDISLMINAGDTAISNGRQVSDTPGPEAGKHTVAFSTTPKMSTYLVALLVGDFVCRSGSSENVPIRICTSPDKLPLTAYALDVARQQLTFFNRYFGVPYPFEKLDIIGVPDFSAGAMENTAAITFRDQYLLADPATASSSTLKTVAIFTAHEIAHQWFGDLVTMKWWDDIWLNEGFATWMETKPLVEWRPDWNVALDDAGDTQSALGLDALRATRPIRTKAETPEEINELFDGIAYQKTAAVLRMIETFVGPEPMRAAVSGYIRKYAYANATGEDFWTEITRATGKPVDRIMNSFVDQAGAPLLSVRTSCREGIGEISMSQSRFVGTPQAADARAAADQAWVLPVCFRTGSEVPRCQVVDRARQAISTTGCEPVFANAGRGYYVTDYSSDIVRALARGVSRLAGPERISLLGDEWWMVRSGRHDIDAYLDLAAALGGDETAAVSTMIGSRLGYVHEFVLDASERPRFEAWVRARFGPALTSLGLPGNVNDDDERQTRRAALLRLLGETGNDPAVRNTARDLALKYIDDPASLSPTLAPAVLEVAALSGDAALYDRYLAQLQKLSGKPEQYYRFFYALAWFSDPALIRRTLDLTLTPAVRSQDVGLLFGRLMGRPAAREVSWAFAKAQWSALVTKLGTFQGIPDILSSTASFCSLHAAADVRQFVARNPVPTAARAVQQALERIESCVDMDKRQSASLERWLAGAR